MIILKRKNLNDLTDGVIANVFLEIPTDSIADFLLVPFFYVYSGEFSICLKFLALYLLLEK